MTQIQSAKTKRRTSTVPPARALSIHSCRTSSVQRSTVTVPTPMTKSTSCTLLPMSHSKRPGQKTHQLSQESIPGTFRFQHSWLKTITASTRFQLIEPWWTPRTQERGYIFVQIEQYGFHEDVLVMVQPYNKFVDHYQNSAVYNETRLYRSYFGYKYLIPAESDILISFKPIAYRANSGMTR
jgi:hypothetical protein